jgi:hypothetical protein
MSKPEKITIAIITFHRDFTLLSNLLQSIYRNWNPNEIDSIKVVLNDKPIYYDIFNNTIERNRHPLFKLDKFFHYQLEPRLHTLDWFSQQMFKCLISDHVDTDWFLINDCKDTYENKVCIDDCFDEHGRAIMHIDHTRKSIGGENTSHWGFGPFSHAYNNSCSIFNVEPEDHKHIHLPYLTPFFVKTSMMKDMVAKLKSSTSGLGGNFFPFLFSLHLDGQLFVTEFLLYNAYCISQNNLKDYIDWDYNQRKFFNSVSHNLDKRNSDGSRKE